MNLCTLEENTLFLTQAIFFSRRMELCNFASTVRPISETKSLQSGLVLFIEWVWVRHFDWGSFPTPIKHVVWQFFPNRKRKAFFKQVDYGTFHMNFYKTALPVVIHGLLTLKRLISQNGQYQSMAVIPDWQHFVM